MKKLILILLFISSLSYSQQSFKISIEGLYDRYLDKITSDTIKIYLADSLYPFKLQDSAKGVLQSSGLITVNFNRAIINNKYFIVVKHRNSIETWSKNSVVFLSNLFYDFTTNSKSFGDNQKLSNGKYHLYSGDVNQSGSIDLVDLNLVYNASNNFDTGYVKEDIDNNNFVDNNDLMFPFNNYWKSRKIPSEVKFVKQNPAMAKLDSHFMPVAYLPVYKRSDDSLVLFYKSWEANGFQTYKATSKNGSVFSNRKKITDDFGASMMINLDSVNLIGYYHKPLVNGHNRYAFTKSSNAGIDWDYTNDTMYTGSKTLNNSYAGEDATAVYNKDDGLYYIYFRNDYTKNENRKIVSLTKTSKFKTFTNRIKLNLIDSINYLNPKSRVYHKTVYSLSVIKNGSDWWGFGNMYVSPENNYVDPCGAVTIPNPRNYCVDVNLFYSTNGVDWKICNDSLPIITSLTMKQIFAIPAIVNNQIFVYTIQRNQAHDCDVATKGNYEIGLYKIFISDLNYLKTN